VLALPLSADTQLGPQPLRCYPSAFGVIDRAKAAILVSMASLALSVAHSTKTRSAGRPTSTPPVEPRDDRRSHGDSHEREHITADQAFEVLRRASQHLNVKLREVAQNLVDTGEDPDTGQRHPRDRGTGAALELKSNRARVATLGWGFLRDLAGIGVARRCSPPSVRVAVAPTSHEPSPPETRAKIELTACPTMASRSENGLQD